MNQREFKALLESLGGVLDAEGGYAIIKNAYGEFKINIETAEVYFKPMQCAYCDSICTEYRQLCLLSHGEGWSNLSLTDRQILTLAKLKLFQDGQFSPEIERQLPGSCIKVNGVIRRPKLHKICLYWQNQPCWATISGECETIAAHYLELLCDAFQVPETIRGQTFQLYNRAVELHLLRNFCIEALITAAFYLVCKKSRIPFTMKELVYTSSLQKKVWLCYRQLLNINT